MQGCDENMQLNDARMQLRGEEMLSCVARRSCVIKKRGPVMEEGTYVVKGGGFATEERRHAMQDVIWRQEPQCDHKVWL